MAPEPATVKLPALTLPQAEALRVSIIRALAKHLPIDTAEDLAKTIAGQFGLSRTHG